MPQIFRIGSYWVYIWSNENKPIWRSKIFLLMIHRRKNGKTHYFMDA